jgi:hypothetical protein
MLLFNDTYELKTTETCTEFQISNVRKTRNCNLYSAKFLMNYLPILIALCCAHVLYALMTKQHTFIFLRTKLLTNIY